MKIKLYLVATFYFAFCGFAFSQGKVYEKIIQNKTQNTISQHSSVFTANTTVNSFALSNFKPSAFAVELNLNSTALNAVVQENPALLQLSIPTIGSAKIELELIPISIFGPSYRVLNAQKNELAYQKGLYYQGIVKGDSKSVASIIIQNGEVSGIVSTDKGNFVLGKLKNSTSYIFYNDHDLVQNSGFICGVNDTDELKKKVENQTGNSVQSVSCEPVQIYLEADYAIYTAQSSNMTTATNFVNALFAQVAVLYSNENIDIQLSELVIWNTADPYVSTTTTGAMLDAFDTQVGSTFNGDLAHLISGRILGGGVAYVDVLCSKPYAHGISADIVPTVVNVPTYSWNVEVVTHELGHNFGSLHTQSCTWAGGPIDNCVGVEDGSCSPGPAPVNGGTIMSYCHLTSNGINFNHGFGPLPGNLIRNRTQSCFGSSLIPTNLVVIEVSSSGALLAWEHGGASYTLRYKLASGSTWTTITTTSKIIQLTGLTANSAYNWEVKANCSNFVASTFMTNSTPTIEYCTPSFVYGCSSGDALNDFIVNSVNWNPTSGCEVYSLSFSPVRLIALNSTNSFTINHDNGYTHQASIWIDLDKNGTFSAAEKLFTTTAGVLNQPITGSFTIPSTVILPITRTRLRLVLNFSSAPTDPCGSYGYGEAEDYLVDLVSPCPSDLVLVNPADNISTGTVLKQASATAGTISATNHITNTAKVTYEAKAINLNAGFKAENGTVFEAKTGGCN
jgi:trimeric autotransporter adhesin